MTDLDAVERRLALVERWFKLIRLARDEGATEAERRAANAAAARLSARLWEPIQ